MPLTGNKGEWSEIYVLLKLLLDRQVCAADENLNVIASRIYPLNKIFRNDSGEETTYNLTVSAGEAEIYKSISPTAKKIYSLVDVPKKIAVLLKKIQSRSINTFSCPEAESVFADLYISRLTTPGSSTSDLDLDLHDARTQSDRRVGFSVKSKLGSPSTLFNANKHSTNFIFRITNLDSKLIPAINAISSSRKIQDRIKRIEDEGGKFEYSSMGSSIFRTNLMMIDMLMPELLAAILLAYYRRQAADMSDLVKCVATANPLKITVPNTLQFYEHKVKQVLIDLALGLRSTSVWSGNNQASGGYLILKRTGDVVCFYIYDYEHLKTYLLNNTKLESPSTTRHEYAKIYLDHGEMFFALNLQIRFK